MVSRSSSTLRLPLPSLPMVIPRLSATLQLQKALLLLPHHDTEEGLRRVVQALQFPPRRLWDGDQAPKHLTKEQGDQMFRPPQIIVEDGLVHTRWMNVGDDLVHRR